MQRLTATIVVAAIAGAVAALAADLISRLAAGSLSPIAGAAIGVAFGITAGNIVAGGGPARPSAATAVLRGVVGGLAAAATIFLLHRG